MEDDFKTTHDKFKKIKKLEEVSTNNKNQNLNEMMKEYDEKNNNVKQRTFSQRKAIIK
jgi:hypothetical protein